MKKIFRVPVAGSRNNRVSASNILNAVSGYVGLGIVGSMIVGNAGGGTTKDQRFINCFSETITDPVTGKPEVYCVKRPGFATSITTGASAIGNALLIWSGQGSGTKVISAFGATNSTIYDSTTSLGAITGKATGITETVISSNPSLLISSSDNTAWTTSSAAVTGAVTFTGDTHTNTTVDNISSTTGLVVGQLLTGTGFAAATRIASIDSPTAITLNTATTATNAGVTITRTVLGKILDADFPGNATFTLAGTFAHLDGYACIMDTLGRLWASDLNTNTAWTANSFGSNNSYPDVGVGCVRHRNFIMCFGTESVEFFHNSGLTPFPFARVQSMTQRVGSVGADAIAQIADTTFWCGSSPQGGLSVFQYDGGIGRISTPEVDQILILAGASNITLTTARFYGRSFVIVKASSTTLVYCIEEKQWSEWSSSAAPWYKIVGVSLGGTMVNYSISKVLTTGIVYTMTPAIVVFQDAGVTYTATMQLDSNDLGTTNRKFWESLRIVADIQSAASPIEISYSDDDYVTTTVWGNLDLSNNLPVARRLGSSRRRAWILNHSANTAMRIRMLEGEATIGTS